MLHPTPAVVGDPGPGQNGLSPISVGGCIFFFFGGFFYGSRLDPSGRWMDSTETASFAVPSAVLLLRVARSTFLSGVGVVAGRIRRGVG